MNIFLVEINCEDGETYRYAFKHRATEGLIKEFFFEDHGKNYKKKDWKKSIFYEIIEIELL